MQKSVVCSALIKQIHDHMEKHANNSLRSQDLTISQVGALVELYSAPEKQLSLKELEKLLHVAQSTSAGIISRLEQKGFVESFGSPEDKRIKLVRLTSAGKECYLIANQKREEADALLLHGLTDTEKSIFLSLLQKVCDTLE